MPGVQSEVGLKATPVHLTLVLEGGSYGSLQVRHQKVGVVHCHMELVIRRPDFPFAQWYSPISVFHCQGNITAFF